MLLIDKFMLEDVLREWKVSWSVQGYIFFISLDLHSTILIIHELYTQITTMFGRIVWGIHF